MGSPGGDGALSGWPAGPQAMSELSPHAPTRRAERAALEARVLALFASRRSPWTIGEIADEVGRVEANAKRQLHWMLARLVDRGKLARVSLGGGRWAYQVLLAIGETIGQQCSICRSRHGSEVRHHAAE